MPQRSPSLKLAGMLHCLRALRRIRPLDAAIIVVSAVAALGVLVEFVRWLSQP